MVNVARTVAWCGTVAWRNTLFLQKNILGLLSNKGCLRPPACFLSSHLYSWSMYANNEHWLFTYMDQQYKWLDTRTLKSWTEAVNGPSISTIFTAILQIWVTTLARPVSCRLVMFSRLAFHCLAQTNKHHMSHWFCTLQESRDPVYGREHCTCMLSCICE